MIVAVGLWELWETRRRSTTEGFRIERRVFQALWKLVGKTPRKKSLPSTVFSTVSISAAVSTASPSLTDDLHLTRWLGNPLFWLTDSKVSKLTHLMRSVNYGQAPLKVLVHRHSTSC